MQVGVRFLLASLCVRYRRGCAQNSKLNVPRVLLPLFKEFCTNFTLEVSGSGCYKWSTSRIDLIRLVTPEHDDLGRDCSASIIVSAISKERTRNTAIVFAEELLSGFILRCDVIVDVISALELVTTTRELYMEEAPEAFEVRAYDDQGNEFSTLEGVEFQWSLSNWNSHQESVISNGSNVLQLITFRDSPYETPPTVQAFDSIGKHGHIVLLEGVKTGTAKQSLTVGDVICFTIPLSSVDGVRGTWETDNESVLSLDPVRGIGKVQAVGNVVVKHHVASVNTFVDLEALAVDSIRLLEPSDSTLTNADLQRKFRVPIILGNAKDKGKTGNLITRNGTCPVNYLATSFPFTCELRFDQPVADVKVQDVFAVHPDFDMPSGTYGCVIMSSGMPTLDKSTLHTNFSLHVLSGSVISKPLKIPFLPAVYVHTKQLNLNDARTPTYVTISGRPDVLRQLKVSPRDGEDFMTVKGLDSVDTTKAQYEVWLTEKYWKEADLTTPMSVIVNSKLTFQNIEVPVKVRVVGESAWSHGPCIVSKVDMSASDIVYYYRHTFTVIGLFIFIIIVPLYAYLHYIQPLLQAVPLQQMPSVQASSGTASFMPGAEAAAGSQSTYHLSSTVRPRSPGLHSSTFPVYEDPQTYYQQSELRHIRARRLF